MAGEQFPPDRNPAPEVPQGVPGQPEQPPQVGAQELISQAQGALSELSSKAAASPEISDSAKQNLSVALKGLDAFVTEMGQAQGPAPGPPPEVGQVGAMQGAGETIPA